MGSVEASVNKNMTTELAINSHLGGSVEASVNKNMFTRIDSIRLGVTNCDSLCWVQIIE